MSKNKDYDNSEDILKNIEKIFIFNKNGSLIDKLNFVKK
jgi:hypothetical protein